MIDRAENLMYIDNAGIVGLSLASLPANVSIVTWDGVVGEIEFNDAPAVRTLFTDPTPYLPMVNAWITAAATGSPALTLTQAKGIKSALVEQFYERKRQLPLSSWEATDEAVVGMLEVLCQPGTGSIAGFVSDYNSVGAAHASNLNSTFSQHLYYLNNSYVSVPDRINPSYNAFYGQLPGACRGVRFSPFDGPTITGGFTSGWPTLTHYTYPALAIPADGTVQWFAIGATAPTAMAYSTFVSGITSQVMSRRNSLQGTRVTKLNQIIALATIAAVAAYDVNAGW